jgi:outer membrane murein-binding lipoprotein Lpp
VNTINGIKQRIEPIVRAAEDKAKATKATVDQIAIQVGTIKSSVDHLAPDVDAQTKRVASLANDIDVQTKRVALTGGELSSKLQKLDEEHRNLQARLEALNTRVQQVSTQVSSVSTLQQYPTLGRKKFIVLGREPLKDPAGKEPKDKWVNIAMFPYALADFSEPQLRELQDQLRGSGYTPLVGSLGVDGPYQTGFAALGDPNNTTVFYFKPEDKAMADNVAKIASKALSVTAIQPRFVDRTKFTTSDDRRFVIENSGIDLQIVILPKSAAR